MGWEQRMSNSEGSVWSKKVLRELFDRENVNKEHTLFEALERESEEHMLG